MVEARSRQVYTRPMSAELYKKKHVEWGEGGHYSPVTVQYPVIDVPVVGHYSPVNNVRGDILGGDTVHYDNGNNAVGC